LTLVRQILAWEPVLWEPCEPVLGSLFLQNLLGNLAWGTCFSQPCLGPLLRNLSFGTLLGILFFLATLLAGVVRIFAWEVVIEQPVLGNLFFEPFLQPCLGTLLDNLAC